MAQTSHLKLVILTFNQWPLSQTFAPSVVIILLFLWHCYSLSEQQNVVSPISFVVYSIFYCDDQWYI